MTALERFNAAFTHREADRVPVDIGGGKSCKMVLGFYQKLLDYYGIREDITLCNTVSQLPYASDAVLEKIGSDVRCVYLGTGNPNDIIPRRWEDENFLYMSDLMGTVFRKHKKTGLYYDMLGFPLADAEDEEDDERFEFPPVPGPDRTNGSREQAIAYHKAGYPVIITEQYGNGFLQNGPRLYGYENWLVMLMLEKDRARKLLDRYLLKKIEYWEGLLDYYGAENVDIISEGDDLGTQNALFVSPELLREMIFPYYKELFGHLKKKYGVKVYMHSCGSIAPVIRDLIELGVDALNPVQTTAAGMDPAMLKREFGKDIVFWGGGIETQNTLPFGTPQQVKDAVKRNLEVFAKDGGYMFATIHNIQPDVPLENFFAMLEAVREFG